MNLSKVSLSGIIHIVITLTAKKFVFVTFVTCITLGTTLTYAQRSGNAPSSPFSPALAWTYSVKAPIISSPIIDEGYVYFGAEDSTWYALELATGKIKWKIAAGSAIRSTPTVYTDQIFLAGGNGMLICADKRTGRVAWRVVYDQTAMFMGERAYDFADYYHSSPVVDNGIIFLATGNGVIGAYSARTGTQLWRYTAGDIIHSQLVLAADMVIVGCFDGYLYALNKFSGQLAWKFKTIGHQYFPKGEVHGTMATDGRRVFFGARDYNFYAIDAASGRAAWNMKFPQGWAMSATVYDTVVYIGTSDDRVMVAADTRSGREYWRTDVRFNTFGAAAIVNGQIIFGTLWGKVYALDRRTGAITWTFETQGFKNHHLKYFGPDERFRPDIGSILPSPFAWIKAEHEMGGIFSAPAVSADMIVVTTSEGNVYGWKR